MDEINTFPQPIDRLRLEELNTIFGKYFFKKPRKNHFCVTVL